MVICVPSGITGVEQRAVMEAAEYAGARKPAYIIEEPMAAAIGAGLPVHEPTGNMVVDIGGGHDRGGGHLARRHRHQPERPHRWRRARRGDHRSYIKKEYSLALGERTAEEIKIKMGSAWPLEEEMTAEIRGRDLITGLPKTIVATTEEVREAIEEPVSSIVDAVKVTLDKTPPELSADIMEQGIVLTGGGALLHGLDQPALGRDGNAHHRRQEPAAFGGHRQWAVPRGVRGPQAGADLLGQSIVPMAVSRRSARPRSTLLVLILASLTLITLDVAAETVWFRASAGKARDACSRPSSRRRRAPPGRSPTSSTGCSSTGS